MSAFEKATRLDSTDRAGVSTLTLDDRWTVGPRLHGGYLLALCARAAVEAEGGEITGHTAPHAVTGTFLRAPRPAPAEVTVHVLRRGRSASQLRVRLDQDGEPCVETAVTLGAPIEPAAGDLVPPPTGLTAHEHCRRSPADSGDGRGRLPLMDVVDTRLDPVTTGFVRDEPSGTGHVTGWGELDDGTPWSPVSLLVALDLLPPATFEMGLSGWTPTMSMSAHVPGVPAPGPVALDQAVETLTGDRMHETCRAWDARGRLVGTATQVAAVRR